MTAPPYKHQETSAYKQQLGDFLGRKNIDQSLLLGFTNLLHPKVQAWILADFNRYFENAQESHDAEFSTIKYFEFVWADIHYPILKFYQSQHADYHNQNLQEFRRCQNEKTAFKLKSVEIRKINGAFLKVVDQFRHFYMGLLKHFLTHFKNPLLPRQLLDRFDYEVPAGAIATAHANVQANVIFLIHRCLLCLGDLSRHRAFNDVNYVLPSSSQKNFQKFRLYRSKDTPKSKTAKDPQLVRECKALCLASYQPSLTLYALCITLLPTLNEPYNHIGMIHNTVGNKPDACYWFLRSRFTRIPHYDLGIKNLESIMTKSWFQEQLGETFKCKWQSEDVRHTSQIVLLNLIGYHYLPQRYRHGELLYGNESYETVEREFMRYEFSQPNFSALMAAPSECVNHFVQSLLVLIMCNDMMSETKNKSLFRLIKHYITGFFAAFDSSDFHTHLEGSAVFLRLCLAFVKENRSFCKYLFRDESDIQAFSMTFNKLIDSFAGDLSTLKSGVKPTREYYFEEDVQFKDFLPIKYQFKDFNDDALFACGSVDVLMGKQEQAEEERTQNTKLRVAAVLGSWEKLMQASKSVEFRDGKFVVDKTVRMDEQMKGKKPAKAKTGPRAKEHHKDKDRPTPSGAAPKILMKRPTTSEPTPETAVPIAPVASQKAPPGPGQGIADIQAAIRSHTVMLRDDSALKGQPEDKPEERMDQMVSSLLDESETNRHNSPQAKSRLTNASGDAAPAAAGQVGNFQAIPGPGTPGQAGQSAQPGQGHIPPPPGPLQQAPVFGPGQYNQPPFPGFVYAQPYVNAFNGSNPPNMQHPSYLAGQFPGQYPPQFPMPPMAGMNGQNGYQPMPPYGYQYSPQ